MDETNPGDLANPTGVFTAVGLVDASAIDAIDAAIDETLLETEPVDPLAGDSYLLVALRELRQETELPTHLLEDIPDMTQEAREATLRALWFAYRKNECVATAIGFARDSEYADRALLMADLRDGAAVLLAAAARAELASTYTSAREEVHASLVGVIDRLDTYR